MEKKMVELFAGVGGFRLGMERLHSGWETVWFSQWEPGKKKQWAHECYVSHFGDCKDLNGEYHTGEDISLMNKENIPDHSLLVGGFPCLTSDTLVWTDSGLKELGSVSVNDKVLTHDGQYKKVLNFFNQDMVLIFLRLQEIINFLCVNDTIHTTIAKELSISLPRNGLLLMKC